MIIYYLLIIINKYIIFTNKILELFFNKYQLLK